MPRFIRSNSLIFLLVLSVPLAADEEKEQDQSEKPDRQALLKQVEQFDQQAAQSVAAEQALQEEIRQARRQSTDLQRQMQEFAKQLEQAQKELTKVQEELKERQEKAQQEAAKRDEAKKAADAARKALEEAQKKADQARKEAEAAAKQAEEAAKPVAQSEQAIKELQEQMTTLAASSEESQTMLAKLEETIQQSEQQVAALREERRQGQVQVEDLLKQAGAWVSFTDQVAPIFHQRCLACHNARTAKGRYNMETYAAIMSGGESGDAIDPGDGEFSTLCVMIEDGSMPQDADPLTPEQIELVKQWVELGARLESSADPQAPLIRIMPRFSQPAPPEEYRVPIPVTALAVHPETNLIASSGYHEVLLWTLADASQEDEAQEDEATPQAKLERRITNVAERVYGMAFHRDGNRLAVASGTPGQLGEVKIFDIHDGSLIADLMVAKDAMFDVTFSPDGEKLAACGADRMIRVFDLQSGDELLSIEDHADWVHSVGWSPDGKQLVSSSRDKTAKIFDAETGNAVITFNGHNDVVTQAKFLPDGKQVISSGRDRRLRVWNVSDAKEARNISGFGDEVTRFELLSDNRVFTASADRKVRLHQFTDGKSLKEFSGHDDWVYSVAARADAETLVSGSYDGRIHMWDVESGESVRSWLAAPGHEAVTTAANE